MTPTIGWLRRPKNGIVLVFVHGLLSSNETAWFDGQAAFWPAMFRDEKQHEDCGVYLAGYRSDTFAGTYSVDDAADWVFSHFKEEIDDVLSAKAIIFVAHSLGGIVARRLVVS